MASPVSLTARQHRLLVVWWFYFVKLTVVVDSVCSPEGGEDGNNNNNNRQQTGSCWYELWYFWLIIVFALIILFIIVLFYCKHHVKRSSSDTDGHRTRVLTMPAGPPRYEDPGHQPPPYHIAASTRQCPSPPQQAVLPGYINDCLHYESAGSFSSTLSIAALSEPPPYSPPHSARTRPRNS